MKVGINLRIDVTKLDKSAFYKGEKGTYVDLTTFVDLDEKDQYGNNGMIKQDMGKERRDENTPILGNARVFWSDGAQRQELPPSVPQGGGDFEDQDIPF